MIKNPFILFSAFFLHLAFLSAIDLPYCTKHAQEIQIIRREAQEAIYQAHRRGGYLFRSSFVSTPEEAAYNSVKIKKTYSEYSAVFNEFMDYCKPAGIPFLEAGYSKMSDSFLKIYNNCIFEHSNLAARYERGKILFDRGLYENCLSDIQIIITSGEWYGTDFDVNTRKDLLLVQGNAQLEENLYEDAIDTLSNLTRRDPKNKEAYFNRACAYFEKGDFDLALEDYLKSDKTNDIEKRNSKVSEQFRSSLFSGLIDGGKEAAVEFVPSLCGTAYGLGECLWCFVQAPIKSSIEFCNACAETSEAVVDYLRTIDKDAIEKLVDEVKHLYRKFDELTDDEKGQAIGYCIGKYGVDIFIGGTTLKCASAVKKLKNANRLANFEALAASETSKEAIKAVAITKASEREAFFKNVKINKEKQNKHIQGKHNFKSDGGIITIPENELELLLKNYAGKGQKVVGELGSAGYKERVDFGYIIGQYALKVEGQQIQYLPTTKGIITYAKDGTAHLYPSNPGSVINEVRK